MAMKPYEDEKGMQSVTFDVKGSRENCFFLGFGVCGLCIIQTREWLAWKA